MQKNLNTIGAINCCTLIFTATEELPVEKPGGNVGEANIENLSSEGMDTKNNPKAVQEIEEIAWFSELVRNQSVKIRLNAIKSKLQRKLE